jgi:hypothetical protein
MTIKCLEKISDPYSPALVRYLDSFSHNIIIDNINNANSRSYVY